MDLHYYSGGARPGGDEPQAPSSHFRGTARTLGGDDAPSRVIEDPSANAPRAPERVERVLHFWSNGFSVDDGPLYDSSEPQNAQILEMIRRGRAPLALMNLQENQEVDVRLEPHDTPYVQPKKKYKPFGGAGQRLGSPTPGVGSSSVHAQTAQPAAPTTPAPSSATQHQVDESLPTVSLQIRLGDGTRLISRFNTSNTIGDVYSFVNASSPSSQARSWVLMTTFPSKELSDKGAKLEDTAELKKGGVVIQKWT
jgi:UBX domain-containing protein 1